MFLLFTLSILTFLFWIAYHISGAILTALFWLFILFPIALLVMAVGILMCCTLILIPIGWSIFKFGWNLLIL